MTIICNDLEQFLECIEGLVRRQLTFTADAHRFVITLTGGF